MVLTDLRWAFLAAFAFSSLALPVHAEPLRVQVLSAVDEDLPDATHKKVRLGTKVTLFAAVQANGEIFAQAPEVGWGPAGARRKPRPVEALGARRSVRWFKVEVAQRSLSNTEGGFHWENIGYRAVPIAACEGRFRCPAQMRATLLADRGGLGTMAFQVEVEVDGARASSPGAQSRFRGGLGPEVARVTVRRDDTYLGYLTELFNTPYIWGSAGEPDAVHQAERLIGSDCADFVTYGVRRLGHKVPYGSTWTLDKHARELAASTGPDAGGVYRGRDGAPIAVGEKGVRSGDLLHFPGHVGAFVRDEPPLGVLSARDVMIHTCWAEPAEEPIADTDYRGQSLRVLRWKVFEASTTR